MHGNGGQRALIEGSKERLQGHCRAPKGFQEVPDLRVPSRSMAISGGTRRAHERLTGCQAGRFKERTGGLTQVAFW